MPRSGKSFPVVVVCEDMLDPLNVGSVFRLADAMGVEHLYLVGASVTPPHRKISKTARSTEKRISFTKEVDKIYIIQALKKKGYTHIGMEITSQSKSILDFQFKDYPKIALWVGSENAGISEFVLDQLDYCVHIPMHGANSSMNVVQALGIGLFEITRQWDAPLG